MQVLLQVLPVAETSLPILLSTRTPDEIADQDFGLPGEGRDMTDSLKRKGVQLELVVWEEAQSRVTEKERKLRAQKKPEFRKVTISEIIAEAFGMKT
jgi:hypothetical protein